MPHTRTYGRHKDGTYAFPVTFHELAPSRIQELFYDDKDVEVTADSWMTHTTNLISEFTDAISKHASAVKSIEPTMNPAYSVKIVVDYDQAVQVQNTLDAHMHAIHPDLYTT